MGILIDCLITFVSIAVGCGTAELYLRRERRRRAETEFIIATLDEIVRIRYRDKANAMNLIVPKGISVQRVVNALQAAEYRANENPYQPRHLCISWSNEPC